MAKKTWASTSSTDFNVAGNWLPSGVPVSNDTLIFINNSIGIDTNLDQHLLTGCTLLIYGSYTGTLGTAATPFQLGFTTLRIGDFDNQGITNTGSGRLNLDAGSGNFTGTIVATASSG